MGEGRARVRERGAKNEWFIPFDGAFVRGAPFTTALPDFCLSSVQGAVAGENDEFSGKNQEVAL